MTDTAEYEAIKRRHTGNSAQPPPDDDLPRIDRADVVRWRGREPPEVVFTIADLVPQGMVTLLTSLGGAGKSLLLQTCCTAIAGKLGTCLGRNAVSGAAAAVFGEDPDAVLHLRQSRINGHFGLNYDQIGGRLFVQSYFGLSAQLWRDRKPTSFMDRLEQQLCCIKDLRFLGLDNTAVLFSGDENSRSEVTEFLSALNGLADRLCIGLILTAHASKSNDGTALRVTSGTTAWVNGSRSVLDLRAPENDEGPKLVVVKANHAATGTQIELEWRNNLLLPVQSIGILASIERRTAEAVFLEQFDCCTAANQKLSPNDHAHNYAARVLARLPKTMRQGYSFADFETALASLIAQREIEVLDYGPPSRRASMIVRVRRNA